MSILCMIFYLLLYAAIGAAVTTILYPPLDNYHSVYECLEETDIRARRVYSFAICFIIFVISSAIWPTLFFKSYSDY